MGKYISRHTGFAPTFIVILVGVALIGGAILLLSNKIPLFKELFREPTKSEEIKTLEGKQIDPTVAIKEIFEPYLPRQIEDLKIVDLFEKEFNREGARGVETESGIKTVSIIEGYRAMYALPSGDYFANMHVDKSVSKSYEEDKKNAVEGMQFTWKEYPQLVNKLDYMGIEYYVGIRHPVFPLIGQAIIFFPKYEIITTIYFLDRNLDNLEKEEPEFEEKINEQRKLQETFIKQIIESSQAKNE